MWRVIPAWWIQLLQECVACGDQKKKNTTKKGVIKVLKLIRHVGVPGVNWYM
jgi:hypothetical protein